MNYGTYRDAFYKAAAEAGIPREKLIVKNGWEQDRAIADYLPIDVLYAVVRGEVIEDNSIIVNNPKAGESIPFYPFWVSMCEEEIIERLITDKT